MSEYAKKLVHTLKSPALGRIWIASRDERFRIILLSAIYALSALLSLAFTVVMKNLVDTAVIGDLAGIRKFAFLLAGVILLILTNGYFRRTLYLKIQTNLLRSMRSDTMKSLMGKQYAAIKQYHSGELVNRIFSDVNIVASGIIDIVPPMLYLVVQLVGAIFLLNQLNSRFMLILLLTGIFGAAASFALRHKTKAFHKETQSAEDHYHARIQETLENFRVIKASGIEQRAQETSDKYQDIFSRARMRRGRFMAFMGTGMGFVFRASWFYALLWGCSGIYHGVLTYGTLTAILQLVGQIQAPFEELISTLSTAYGAVSSQERLIELFDMPDDDLRDEDGTDQLDFSEIRLSNLSFSYDSRKRVLNDVSLTIHRNDMIAIMGQSGCGKSTLFLVMLGIYTPDAGTARTVMPSGEECRIARSLFAYVPQGNALFSGTLRENIAMFARRPLSDEEIREAARIACIDEFIEGTEAGLDARIGEHGLGLSEGQAQRIAIARAVAMDTPILLLDEATSALDEETEANVLKNISAMQGKTCIIVTHRPAALKVCGRRVKMVDGVASEE